MRYAIIFLICFLMATCLYDEAQAQDTNRRYKLPGYVQINDTLFMMNAEVSFAEYFRFLIFARKVFGNDPPLNDLLPMQVSLTWQGYNYYTKQPIYYTETIWEINDSTLAMGPLSGFPVVNISKAQALAYCAFRGQDYAIFHKKLSARKKKKYPPNLFFRLPTEKEWLAAAAPNSPSGAYLKIKNKGKVVCKETIEAEPFKEPFPIFNGIINEWMLHNMLGNVAEMVMDTDFVYGGSYDTPCAEINQKQPFEGPSDKVGFRVVAVIREPEHDP